MQDNRKISICIPTWERDGLLFKSFEQVHDDERVSEIIIVDDCSNQGLYDLLIEKCKAYSKVKLFRNAHNQDCYKNKAISVSHATNDFCILFDSDNVLDKEYIDRIFEIQEWDKHTAYLPSFAKPLFSYTQHEGVTITRENAASYIMQSMMSTCLNCMNYFVHGKEFLRVRDEDVNPHTSDSLFQNYNWLKHGNKLYIVKDLHYEHLVHQESHYIKNHEKTGKFHNELMQKIFELR